MEKLYTVSKNKTGSLLWLRSWTPYCQIKTYIEESRVNQQTIQVWPKLNPLWLYSGSDKQIQGIRPDTVHEELWTKVSDIVQEGVIKTIPKKKKCKKGKIADWGGLTNSCEKREAKGKGENERYTHLNAEFQRRARRDKKAFLNDQSKETEETNRIGKTRHLFKKTVENSSRDGNTTWPASWETCMQVRKQQLELDMEQQTGSK